MIQFPWSRARTQPQPREPQPPVTDQEDHERRVLVWDGEVTLDPSVHSAAMPIRVWSFIFPSAGRYHFPRVEIEYRDKDRMGVPIWLCVAASRRRPIIKLILASLVANRGPGPHVFWSGDYREKQYRVVADAEKLKAWVEIEKCDMSEKKQWVMADEDAWSPVLALALAAVVDQETNHEEGG